MRFIKKNRTGILLAVIIMLAAKGLSYLFPTLGVALIALLLGIIVRQFLKQFEVFQSGIVWTEKYVLETSTVLIGFGFQFSQLETAGLSAIGFVMLSVVLVLIVALLLRKIFRGEGTLCWLVGAGSAICGSAAIGATAPLLKSKEEETGISLAVVNLLGLFGMILLPLIASLLHFSPTETGIFLGGILQSMGHVVGASFSISPEIGQVATVVKMSRIALLMPFLFVVYFLFRQNSENKTSVSFPVFILFFAASVMLSQTDIFSAATLKTLSQTGEALLNISLAAIGLKINLRNLWNISGKAIWAGTLIFVFQIAIYVAFLKFIM